MAPRGLLAAALSIASLTLRVHAECFLIDGTPAGDSYQPCNPDAEFSACCATNKGAPDICLSSGLCYSQDAQFKGFVYSNGCTDRTGQAEECPHFCPDRTYLLCRCALRCMLLTCFAIGTNDWNGGEVIDSYNVLQCNTESDPVFCCRAAKDTDNCCANSTDTVDIGTMLLATVTTSIPATATTITITMTDSATPTDYVGSECPRVNTAIVGGALGGGLGAALLASLGVIAVMWKRRRATDSQIASNPNSGAFNVSRPWPSEAERLRETSPASKGYVYYVAQEEPVVPMHELDSGVPRSEM